MENIRFWQEDRSVRIVVDVTGNVTFKEGEASSPDRFFIDISPARLNSTLIGKEWAVESTAFQKIRVAQFDVSTVRIVLDGPSLKDVTASNLKDPNKIIGWMLLYAMRRRRSLRQPTTTAPVASAGAAPSTPLAPTGLAVTSAWCESRDDYPCHRSPLSRR